MAITKKNSVKSVAKLFLTSSSNFTIHLLAGLANIKPERTKVGFINNACDLNNDPLWVKDEYDAYEKSAYKLEKVDLNEYESNNLKKKLESFDIIHIAGGNTYYLQKILIKSGAFEIIPEILKNDSSKIYIGSSAGSMIAGPNIELGGSKEELDEAGEMEHFKGMNLVEFEIFPHWGRKDFKEEYQESYEAMYMAKYPILTLEDNKAVWVNNDMLEIIDESHLD